MTEYLVIFERADDGGWGAYLPDLPGVVALLSVTELEENVRVARRHLGNHNASSLDRADDVLNDHACPANSSARTAVYPFSSHTGAMTSRYNVSKGSPTFITINASGRSPRVANAVKVTVPAP